MPNKFISFLDHVGQDLLKGLSILDPFLKTADSIIPLIDPALGPIVHTTIGTIIAVEQKYVAMGKQTGTGPQKLAEATTILQPVISQAFAAAGKQNDVPTVQGYISALVNFLNAIPAANPAQ